MTRSSRALVAALALVALGALWFFWLPDSQDGSAARTGRVAEGPRDSGDREKLTSPVILPNLSTTSETIRVQAERPPDPQPTDPEAEDRGLPFRGRVVDVANGDPVAGAHVQLGQTQLQVPTDAAGRFEGKADIYAAGYLRVLDHHHGTHIRDAQFHELLVQADGSLLVRIAIGPTTRFLLPPEVENDNARAWQARLVFIDPSGFRDEQSWQPARGKGQSPSDPGWFRYDNPLVESTQAANRISRILMEARTNDGTLIAEGPVGSAIGISQEIVQLMVTRRMGNLKGRVVNTQDWPLNGVDIYAFPVQSQTLGSGAALSWDLMESTRPENAGQFELPALEPGPWSLLFVHENSATTMSRRVHVKSGNQEISPVIFDLPLIVGDITGTIVAETGGIGGAVFVSLRALEGPFREIDTINDPTWIFSSNSSFPMETRHLRENAINPFPRVERPFRFSNIPAGRYAVSVVDPAGAAWSPVEVVVNAPFDSIVFTRIDDNSRKLLTLEAIDARDGSVLDVVDVRVERAGSELMTRRMPTGEPGMGIVVTGDLRLFVSATGYAATEVAPSEITSGADGYHARVELQPGWSGRLTFLDCEGRLDVVDLNGNETWLAREDHPPLQGIVVLVNGQAVATSAADGVAELHLDSPPSQITFRSVDGSRFLCSRRVERGQWQGDEREGVVWMFKP